MRTVVDRRLFTMGLLALAPTRARADNVNLRIGLLPITDVAPVYVGIKHGFFTEQGLSIETVPSTGGAAGIPAIVSGSLDITYSNVVSDLVAAQQGLDIKVIATTLSGAPDLSGIIVRRNDRLETGADLHGKTLAVNTRNNVIWLFARQWVQKTGGDPRSVIFREVPFPQMGDALKQKQVDAIFEIEPFRSTILGDPSVEEIALPYKEVQPHLQVAHYITSGALLQKRPETIDRFLRGLEKANAWYDAHLQSDELTEIVMGYTGSTRDVVQSLPRRPTFGSLDIAEIAVTMALMRESGLLKADVDLGKLIYVPAK